MDYQPPMPFLEALKSKAIKSLLPTTMGSAEIRALDAKIKELAFLSARVVNAEILQEFSDKIDRILNPAPGLREDGRTATDGLDYASARMELKDALKRIGYAPDAGDEDTIKDLRTDGRLNLVLRTNTELALGYGQYEQANDPAVVDEWPCSELFRAESRAQERDWESRWKEAATTSGDGDAYRCLVDNGRMIARKDSPIWDMLGSMWDDSLGNPYSPLAFRTGMWQRDVDRATSIELGLIGQDDQVTPQRRDFGDTLQMTPDVRDAALKEALMHDVGADYEFKDGVLVAKG
jgi:hypothetical protein